MGPAANSGDSTSASAPAPAPASASARSLAQAPASAPAAAVDNVPTPRRTASFLSRLSFPWRSRPLQHVVDFHIRPAEPHRQYQAGDPVRGAVILTIVKPVRITHLTVVLHGYVRVYKGPGGATSHDAHLVNPAETPSGRTASSRLRYHGNGHVSLFQDEQVLSADGRLDPGKYEFNFDLMFPAKPLPSSIDFERGTIAYMITATLTRPVPTEPTRSCTRRIMLVDRLDVGSLAPPRPRTIYLEPISRRSRKRKHQIPPLGPNDTPDPAPEPDSGRPNGNSTEGTSSASAQGDDYSQDGTNPRSPTHSDIQSLSEDSAPSESMDHGRVGNGDAGHSSQRLGGSTHKSKRSLLDDRTITATVKMLKGGCLPGDLVSVKILVQHVRPIKSMHGVITTLYRQGRIDTAPPLPSLGLSKEEIKQMEKEQPYPKSKTGLGGLSLSASGSYSMFRKDLSQTFSPLIVDPVTLTATITASVRMPEDSFPGIKGVPGDMITFKYQVEVIIDLEGKLASQLQGGGGSSSGRAPGGPMGVLGSALDRTGPGPGATWGTSIADTEPVRREKGVVTFTYEVVVGTTDSSRLRGKAVNVASSVSDADGGSRPDEETLSIEDYAIVPPVRRPPGPYHLGGDALTTVAVPEYVPPPHIPDLTGLSEKELVRRAEQRLLPSQPEASGSGTATEPSAPLLARSHNGAGQQEASESYLAGYTEGPSAPTLEETLSRWAGRPGPDAAAEDKQELERQRLLAEASAPPDFPEDYDGAVPTVPGGPGGHGSGSAPAAPAADEPSAPVLTEEDEFGYGVPHTHDSTTRSSASAGPRTSTRMEPLPRYER